jgi:hypothetical protein
MATIKDHGSWKDMSWQKVIAKNRKLSTLWNQSQRSLVLGILNGWKKKKMNLQLLDEIVQLYKWWKKIALKKWLTK